MTEKQGPNKRKGYGEDKQEDNSFSDDTTKSLNPDCLEGLGSSIYQSVVSDKSEKCTSSDEIKEEPDRKKTKLEEDSSASASFHPDPESNPDAEGKMETSSESEKPFLVEYEDITNDANSSSPPQTEPAPPRYRIKCRLGACMQSPKIFENEVAFTVHKYIHHQSYVFRVSVIATAPKKDVSTQAGKSNLNDSEDAATQTEKKNPDDSDDDHGSCTT